MYTITIKRTCLGVGVEVNHGTRLEKHVGSCPVDSPGVSVHVKVKHTVLQTKIRLVFGETHRNLQKELNTNTSSISVCFEPLLLPSRR